MKTIIFIIGIVIVLILGTYVLGNYDPTKYECFWGYGCNDVCKKILEENYNIKNLECDFVGGTCGCMSMTIWEEELKQYCDKNKEFCKLKNCPIYYCEDVW